MKKEKYGSDCDRWSWWWRKKQNGHEKCRETNLSKSHGTAAFDFVFHLVGTTTHTHSLTAMYLLLFLSLLHWINSRIWQTFSCCPKYLNWNQMRCTPQITSISVACYNTSICYTFEVRKIAMVKHQKHTRIYYYVLLLWTRCRVCVAGWGCAFSPFVIRFFVFLCTHTRSE